MDYDSHLFNQTRHNTCQSTNIEGWRQLSSNVKYIHKYLVSVPSCFVIKHHFGHLLSHLENIESYMSAHVLLNAFNELRKCKACVWPEINYKMKVVFCSAQRVQ